MSVMRVVLLPTSRFATQKLHLKLSEFELFSMVLSKLSNCLLGLLELKAGILYSLGLLFLDTA